MGREPKRGCSVSELQREGRSEHPAEANSTVDDVEPEDALYGLVCPAYVIPRLHPVARHSQWPERS